MLLETETRLDPGWSDPTWPGQAIFLHDLTGPDPIFFQGGGQASAYVEIRKGEVGTDGEFPRKIAVAPHEMTQCSIFCPWNPLKIVLSPVDFFVAIHFRIFLQGDNWSNLMYRGEFWQCKLVAYRKNYPFEFPITAFICLWYSCIYISFDWC